MPMRALTLSLAVHTLTMGVHAQLYDWGWAPEVSVTQNGSTITCTVWDPLLNSTRNQSYSGVATWTHDDGVVATVSNAGIAMAIVYDINIGGFRNEQLTTTSGTTVINSDGVVAWVSGGGVAGASIYHPGSQEWVSAALGSGGGNVIQNRDGVVSWTSGNGRVGAAVFDPFLEGWQDEQFTVDGQVVEDREGVVTWVTTSGLVGAAVYDPPIHQWRAEHLGQGDGTVVTEHGMVAWRSSAGSMNMAVYEWNGNDWNHATVGSDPSNSVPWIVDGAVRWTNSAGAQQYGYTAAGTWQSGAATAIRCEYTAEQISAVNLHLAYLWCLSIGASSYVHACGDGHLITRRWAWKQYAEPGSYAPQLTVYNEVGSSACNGQLNFVNTAVIDPVVPNVSHIVAHEGAVQITTDAPLGQISIMDAQGRLVYAGTHATTTAHISINSAAGVHALHTATGAVYRFVLDR